MTTSVSKNPEALSFEAAIDLTQSLLDQMEAGALAAAEIEQTIAQLVNSENGARGFFVTFLSDDRPLVDHPSDSVIQALQSAPEQVASLLVKNLAMSTAMAIAHRHNQNEDLAQGSDRVQRRSLRLIRALQSAQLQQQAHELANSINFGTGSYQTFLQRWGYDEEQKLAIHQALTEAGLL